MSLCAYCKIHLHISYTLVGLATGMMLVGLADCACLARLGDSGWTAARCGHHTMPSTCPSRYLNILNRRYLHWGESREWWTSPWVGRTGTSLGTLMIVCTCGPHTLYPEAHLLCRSIWTGSHSLGMQIYLCQRSASTPLIPFAVCQQRETIFSIGIMDNSEAYTER